MLRDIRWRVFCSVLSPAWAKSIAGSAADVTREKVPAARCYVGRDRPVLFLICFVAVYGGCCESIDLPLNFHPAAIRVSAGVTRAGAGRATCDRRSWSGLRSRSHVAVRLAA